MQKYYEITYIAVPTLNEKEIEALQNKVKSFIQEMEGKIENELSPIKTKLGYPIKKFSEGFLVSIEFSLLPEKIDLLDKKIKETPEILRHLIINKKKPSLKPAKTKETKIKKPKKVELKDLEEKLKEILEE